jgi:hypothetical protein
MKSLKDFILEREMKFEKKFELEFTINKSFHATERQSRHGSDEEHFISDDEILETVKKASKTIIEDIINDNINIDDRFIVRDANTDLNIVCQLHRGTSKDSLRVDIVTLIRTDKFWNTKQNWVVMIR